MTPSCLWQTICLCLCMSACSSCSFKSLTSIPTTWPRLPKNFVKMVSSQSREVAGQKRMALSQPAYPSDNGQIQTRKKQIPFARMANGKRITVTSTAWELPVLTLIRGFPGNKYIVSITGATWTGWTRTSRTVDNWEWVLRDGGTYCWSNTTKSTGHG
jgi:hypothetical protein